MRFYALQEGPGIPTREELSGGSGHMGWIGLVVVAALLAFLLKAFAKHLIEEGERKEQQDLADWQKANRAKR